MYTYLREAKRQYHYAIRRIKRKENELRKEKFLEYISANNTRDLFKEIKKINGRKQSPMTVNNLTDHKEIAECFAKKYEQLYNCKSNDKMIMNKVMDYIDSDLKQCQQVSSMLVSLDCVKKAVKNLKQKKSDGDKGYCSSHLIYASDKYFTLLAQLLTAMFVHGHQPNDLLLATIISIPKDSRGDLGSDTNYRGIALSSSIGKLFDLIFIEKNIDKLSSSDLQFAYKKNSGTSMCTLIVREIVKYYMDYGSNVYMCCIDATKAFDKIRHDKLFLLLAERGLSGLDLRLLLNLYQRQQVRTSWQNEQSHTFGVSNGIRQGSIASPILFCCYMDELVKRLKKQGIGCWIGGQFCATVAYADDLSLLSPTLHGLQCLINTCEEFGKEFGMSYNPNKSFCVHFSRKKSPTGDVFLDGNKLNWLTEAKHLGNYISSDLKESREVAMKKSDFVGRVNNLISFSPQLTSRNVLMTVFRSQCCHFYGMQAWQLSDPSVTDFYTMWNKCVRRLLNIPRTTHRRFLPHLAEMKKPVDRICTMFINMLKKMLKSENEFINFIARRSLRSSNSIIAMNTEYILSLYRSSDIHSATMNSNLCSDEDLSVVQAIKDILDGNLLNVIDKVDFFEILYFLCTN